MSRSSISRFTSACSSRFPAASPASACPSTGALRCCHTQAYIESMLTPGRVETSRTERPCSITCRTTSALNSSVYCMVPIPTSVIAVMCSLKRSREPGAIQIDSPLRSLSRRNFAYVDRVCTSSPHRLGHLQGMGKHLSRYSAHTTAVC